jgi:hypothetical protein
MGKDAHPVVALSRLGAYSNLIAVTIGLRVKLTGQDRLWGSANQFQTAH